MRASGINVFNRRLRMNALRKVAVITGASVTGATLHVDGGTHAGHW
jgi:hypothetical protein